MSFDHEHLVTFLLLCPPRNRYSADGEDVRSCLRALTLKLQERSVPNTINFPDEFSERGIFCDFFARLSAGEQIDVQALLMECLFLNYVGCVVEAIYEQTSTAKVVQLDGATLAVRIDECERSSGFMHGLMEEVKKEFPVSYYSCQRSNLDDVFSKFTSEDLYIKLNSKFSG